MIQVDETGKIITINAPQPSELLTSLAVTLPPEVASQPDRYRWDGESFVLSIETSNIALQHSAKRYLEATDFYVTRKLETGEAIPNDIQEKRQKARDRLAASLPELLL